MPLSPGRAEPSLCPCVLGFAAGEAGTQSRLSPRELAPVLAGGNAVLSSELGKGRVRPLPRLSPENA